VRLSIVVPVLNESRVVDEFLRRLRQAAPEAEIIVVDGGSQDGTAARARALADLVITAPTGRGEQMNAGALAARGESLWFLHADSGVTAEAVSEMHEFMRDPATAGGCFSLKIVPSRWIYRLRDAIGNRCVDRFGIALGDRGLFCRRTAFESAGRYSSRRLFEDADLYRSLHRVGLTRRLRAAISTSSRRYETQGPIRTCLFYGLVMALYWAGLSRRILEPVVFFFFSRTRPGKMEACRHAFETDDVLPILERPSSPLKSNLQKIHP
jgi:rSAM/selenodomain-associated transferase 2